MDDLLGNKEIVRILKDSSLTPTQLQIYIYLLSHGPKPISELTSELKKDRAAVYKHLEKLMRLGLVEKELGRNFYMARPPQELEKILIKALEEHYTSGVERVKNLIASIPVEEGRKAYPPPQYRLIFGRSRLYNELKKLFEETFHEYRLIMSGNGLLRSIRYGLLEDYMQMAKRGVKMMIISEVNQLNIKEAEFLYSYIPFKHMEGIQIRLNIFDHDKVLIGAIQHDEDMSINRSDDSYILINDPKLASGLIVLFENLWKSAEDAASTIKRLTAGSR
ncbi:MAG: TrmB family transcriptional regulator [Nitrososphaeria archaeon]